MTDIDALIEWQRTNSAGINPTMIATANALAEQRDEIARLRARVAELEYAGNLLAVMHGDGGHYQGKHGTRKAVDDAIEKYSALRVREDYLAMHARAMADAIEKHANCIHKPAIAAINFRAWEAEHGKAKE